MSKVSKAGSDANGSKVANDEIINLADVAKRIGIETRGKAMSPQRVRMLTDRNTIKVDGVEMPGPLKLVGLKLGKRIFTYIADGDPEIDWPEGVTDSVAAYIEGVKSGKYTSRIASGRVVFHQSATIDGSAPVAAPEGWTLPDGLSFAAAVEALAVANGLAYKLQARKADDDDSETEDDSADADADAARLAREQQVNAERDSKRNAPASA